MFAALLRGDPTSYLYSDPPFEPIPKLAPKGRFGLAELINAALRPNAMNPAPANMPPNPDPSDRRRGSKKQADGLLAARMASYKIILRGLA